LLGRGPPVRPHMLDSWGCWLCTMANTALTHLLRHIGCSCPNAYPDVMQLCQDFTCIGCTRDITGRHVQAAALFLRYAPPVQQSFTRQDSLPTSPPFMPMRPAQLCSPPPVAHTSAAAPAHIAYLNLIYTCAEWRMRSVCLCVHVHALRIYVYTRPCTAMPS